MLLWVDTFTDHFSPEVGQAAVAVLEDAGFRVEIPRRATCCGLTWISTGQLDGARRQLRRTLETLGPELARGIPIVGLEPSCTAALRSDAVELLPRRAARGRRSAASLRTLAELLAARTSWTPPSLAGVTAVAQPHCHQHAVMGWDADAALLAAAGADVTAVGGCCGLAGNFGVERGHYDVSVAVAETALLPAVRRPRPTPSSSPTGSPAVPSSTSSPAATASTWSSCWPTLSTRTANLTRRRRARLLLSARPWSAVLVRLRAGVHLPVREGCAKACRIGCWPACAAVGPPPVAC